MKQRKQAEALQVLTRIVMLEPTQANYLRMAEVCLQLGESKTSAVAYLKTAELAEAAGADASQYLERAYGEDPSDPRIALGYGKSLLAQGQIGAAIFIFEPHVLGGIPRRSCATITAKRCWPPTGFPKLSRWCGSCSSRTPGACSRWSS